MLSSWHEDRHITCKIHCHCLQDGWLELLLQNTFPGVHQKSLGNSVEVGTCCHLDDAML